MKSFVVGIFTVVSLGISGSAFGSGFVCESDDGSSNYRVKMFNHTSPSEGTRVPAVLVISDETEGTLLVRKGNQIRKHNRLSTVQYTVEGSRRLAADKAILQVHFKEGKEVIEAGDSVDAELILIADEDKSVYSLSCERTLKDQE